MRVGICYCHWWSDVNTLHDWVLMFFSIEYPPTPRNWQWGALKNETLRHCEHSITINWNISISCIYEWMKCCQTRTTINEWFILLRDIILLMKSQLVTSYSLNLDVNRCFWNPDLSVCKYDWSYYYWSLYCYLTIVMIWKYLKSDKSWSIVWIFAMAPNFSYFVQ